MSAIEAERDALRAVVAAVRKRALQSEWIVCGELLRIMDEHAASVPTEPTGGQE